MVVASDRGLLKDCPRTVGTRVVGLPMHVWSTEVVKAIGDPCGGWVETEDEMELQNHLKWARIRGTKGGSRVPKEITLEHKGIFFTLQIWVESQARISTGEERLVQANNQQIHAGWWWW